jgi:predicted transcriptional regulator
MLQDNIDDITLDSPQKVISKKDRIVCLECKKVYQKQNKTNHLKSKYHLSHINCQKRLVDIAIKYPEEHNKIQEEVYYI